MKILSARAAIITALLVGPAMTCAAEAASCAPQELPPAINSAGRPQHSPQLIEFAATPYREYPGRAWVVRLSGGGRAKVTLEVVRLRRQADCNLYDVEKRWTTVLNRETFDQVVASVQSYGLPAPDTFSQRGLMRRRDRVLDGTGIQLRMSEDEWQVSRSLNLYTRPGGSISTIFHELAARAVPPSDMPPADWRVPRR